VEKYGPETSGSDVKRALGWGAYFLGTSLAVQACVGELLGIGLACVAATAYGYPANTTRRVLALAVDERGIVSQDAQSNSNALYWSGVETTEDGHE